MCATNRNTKERNKIILFTLFDETQRVISFNFSCQGCQSVLEMVSKYICHNSSSLKTFLPYTSKNLGAFPIYNE